MIKHIILWKLKADITDPEAVKEGIKTNLEKLNGQIPGMVSLCVRYDFLKSSNSDIMLDSTFENEEAMNGYFVHPAHVAVADEFVRPFTEIRMAADFIA